MFPLKCLLIKFIQPDFVFSKAPFGIRTDDVEVNVV